MLFSHCAEFARNPSHTRFLGTLCRRAKLCFAQEFASTQGPTFARIATRARCLQSTRALRANSFPTQLRLGMNWCSARKFRVLGANSAHVPCVRIQHQPPVRRVACQGSTLLNSHACEALLRTVRIQQLRTWAGCLRTQTHNSFATLDLQGLQGSHLVPFSL